MYSFPGFRASARLAGEFGDPDLRVVRLVRKKRPAPVPAAARRAARFTTGAHRARAIWARAGFASSSNSSGCA
jgi:hypothetical protein